MMEDTNSEGAVYDYGHGLGIPAISRRIKFLESKWASFGFPANYSETATADVAGRLTIRQLFTRVTALDHQWKTCFEGAQGSESNPRPGPPADSIAHLSHMVSDLEEKWTNYFKNHVQDNSVTTTTTTTTENEVSNDIVGLSYDDIKDLSANLSPKRENEECQIQVQQNFEASGSSDSSSRDEPKTKQGRTWQTLAQPQEARVTKPNPKNTIQCRLCSNWIDRADLREHLNARHPSRRMRRQETRSLNSRPRVTPPPPPLIPIRTRDDKIPIPTPPPPPPLPPRRSGRVAVEVISPAPQKYTSCPKCFSWIYTEALEKHISYCTASGLAINNRNRPNATPYLRGASYSSVSNASTSTADPGQGATYSQTSAKPESSAACYKSTTCPKCFSWICNVKALEKHIQVCNSYKDANGTASGQYRQSYYAPRPQKSSTPIATATKRPWMARETLSTTAPFNMAKCNMCNTWINKAAFADHMKACQSFN